MRIDDFLFDPCGYSMNGINKSVSTQVKFSYHLAPLQRSVPSYLTLNFVDDFSGTLYDYSHNTRVGVLICQL